MKPHGLYQPFIQDHNIRRLYRLKVQTKTPMTKLLNHILDTFFGAEEAAETAAPHHESVPASPGRLRCDAVKYSKDTTTVPPP